MKKGNGREELTRVGHGDFVDLIGVEPDLASPTLENACGQPLLELQRNHLSLSLSLSLEYHSQLASLQGRVLYIRKRIFKNSLFTP